MTVRRGEVYWVGFDPVKGSEQVGQRPALVVQHDTGNLYSPTTVVVAITRTLPPRPYPFVVIIGPEEGGLAERSAINCARIATIQQAGASSRLRPCRSESEVRPVGRLSQETMQQVDEGLRFNLGLE